MPDDEMEDLNGRIQRRQRAIWLAVAVAVVMYILMSIGEQTSGPTWVSGFLKSFKRPHEVVPRGP
jgi:hypothetical protein